jgi:FKBP-type peptidyl-prolyl cis-trans isomerase
MSVKFNRYLFLLISAVILSSCLGKYVENDIDKIYRENEAQILEFASKNNLNLSKDPSTGLYYRILESNPSGLVADAKYDFYVAFKLSKLDGTVIDEKTAVDSLRINLYLTDVFDGFLASLLLLKEKEKGQFFIPSYLAYGNNPPANIQKNEVIILEIEILDLISEDEKIEAYIAKKNLVVEKKTDTGLRFIRQNVAVSGVALKNGDVLSVKYNGMYLSEVSFDSGTFAYTIGAGNVIAGFDEALRLMKKGEKVRAILPSSIGYGTQGNSKIPPHTPLIFDLEILTVNGN